jgi:hypothetical protein
MKVIGTYEWEINHNNSEHPGTYREAMTRPDVELWHKAALEELRSHEENQTWTLVDLSKNETAIKG